MAVTREARYLSGNDIGKTVTVGTFSGTLIELCVYSDSIILYITGAPIWESKLVQRNTLVTITGQSSKDKQMIKRLLDKLQGKTWGAHCNICAWDAGRQDLSKEQARDRANMHRMNRHGWIFDTSLREPTIFKKWAVNKIYS